MHVTRENTMTSINLSWGFVAVECNFLDLGLIRKGNILRLGPVKTKSRHQQLNGPPSSPSSIAV